MSCVRVPFLIDEPRTRALSLCVQLSHDLSHSRSHDLRDIRSLTDREVMDELVVRLDTFVAEPSGPLTAVSPGRLLNLTEINLAAAVLDSSRLPTA